MEIAITAPPPTAHAGRGARGARAELADGAAEPLRQALQCRREAVIGDHRWDRRDQPQRRGEQRLGDAGGDHREAGVVGLGDRGEAVHDAPHRAEQADEGCSRADRREEGEARLQTPELTRRGFAHGALDALPALGAALVARGVDPFAEPCAEDRLRRALEPACVREGGIAAHRFL
jgi:hypothetical protein